MAGLDPQGLHALKFERSTYHYKSRRSDHAALEHRIKEIRHAPAFGMATVAFTSCFVVKLGAIARTRHGASIADWACNYAKRRPSAG